MQSESHESSQKNLLNQNSPNNYLTNQYGLDHPAQQPTHQLHAGEGSSKSRRSASKASSTASSSGSSEQSLENPFRGLRRSSPVDRIAEHEKSLSYLPKKRNQGPSFAVIQRGRNATTGQVVLADFPNEVLTHILSHLPPSSLSDVSLVSHRFHHLVTTPHAWRIAFSRFFPGAEAMDSLDNNQDVPGGDEVLHAESRLFTRLTALASWRSEYILRTRLIRSLSRGKPFEAPLSSNTPSSRAGASSGASAQITYNSDLVTTVDHLQATFGTGFNKRLPRFIHGATDVGMATASDPKTGKVDSWGLADNFVAHHFEDVYPGEALYGLGHGDILGIPNSMDVSQLYGMVCVEGLPGGRAYYRSTEEKRGRILAPLSEESFLDLGIPSNLSNETLTATWIAKSASIPDLSEGLVGILVGSSRGTLSSYSLGTNPLQERRLDRGELTARWILSPGVPIIAVAVDEHYSLKRQSSNRIWAAALNALGEVFYLCELPVRRSLDRAVNLDGIMLEKTAWETGRTVCWELVDCSKRTARPDPFETSTVDSHTPRTSCNRMALSREQIIGETRAISSFLQKKPNNFRKVCEAWDMRRRMEVDFAASDEHGAGEGIVVISCGFGEEQQAGIKRYSRCLLRRHAEEPRASTTESRQAEMSSQLDIGNEYKVRSSIFSNSAFDTKAPSTWSFSKKSSPRRSSSAHEPIAPNAEMRIEWRTSTFVLSGVKTSHITVTAIDMSSFALLTSTEDPLLSMTGSSVASSPMSSPSGQVSFPNSLTHIPGQRARFLAVGTDTGIVILWNMRAPIASNVVLENNVLPLRVIQTDSPQISCLGLSALYLVHGGNDGLVQAWDPLASSSDPTRTLNSRFSSRARRRLVQAEASPAGVGINLFAAGAICLDPDPTVLRGMVSLGSHLRYWGYSSQAADVYKGNKRRLRRAERGSNQGGERFSGTGRGALKDYIANEKVELEREKRIKRKEDSKLSARYGVDLLGPGATEDEILAYATLLSEEAAKDDEQKRKSTSECSSSDPIQEEAMASPVPSTRNELDDDMAEAIRLSLEESNGFRASSLGDGDASASSFTVRYAKSKRSSPSPSPPRSSASPTIQEVVHEEPIRKSEMDDLEFALQLSRVEEESRLGKATSHGNGKKRAF